MIYLDAAATTLQKPDTVRLAVLRAMQRCASVGRGGYGAAMEAAEAVLLSAATRAKTQKAVKKTRQSRSSVIPAAVETAFPPLKPK